MKKIYKLLSILVILTSCSQKTTQVLDNDNSERVFDAALAVQAYSFRNYFPGEVLGTLDRIAQMGITEIEGEPGRIDPADYKKLCEERGLSIPSTGASFDELEKNPKAVADRCKILGSKFVMCAWVPHNRGEFSKNDADKAIEVFNNAGKVLAEEGITLCYHAHGYEFQPYGDGTLLDYIIQSTDDKYVSFEMDIFWIHFGGGDPVGLLNKYGSRWKLMHLKDMKKGTPKDMTGLTDVENNVPLGQGELDIPAIIKAAKKVGIQHYFIEDESSSVMAQVPESIAYLRSLKQ